MMKKTLPLIVMLFLGLHLRAQDTFSIVAADSATRETGSAGASCVDLISMGFSDPGFIGDLLPDTGAINTQAYYISTNQDNARARMRAGDTPAQIINWLTTNDVQSNPALRQYGIVGFTGNLVSARGYTGTSCQDYKGHRTGSMNGIYYSIQGNILLGQQVLDSMEARFRKEDGDLACRLMAAMQGAKMAGADMRCTANGTSSLFAYLKVSRPTDAYGSPSLKVGVRTQDNAHIEPIDSLQTLFDMQHVCGNSGMYDQDSDATPWIFPNPVADVMCLRQELIISCSAYAITDILGQTVMSGRINIQTRKIDLSVLHSGVYFLHIPGTLRHAVKIIKL